MDGNWNMRFLFELESKGCKNVIDFCIDNGFIASNFNCPKCNAPMKLAANKDITDGYLWYCRMRTEGGLHHVKKSIRSNSLFGGSRTSITNILLLAYLWISQAKVNFISRELHVGSKTVTEWMNCFRDLCVEICVHESFMLGGEGIVVEIQESKLIDRESVSGNRIKGNCVLAGVEKNTPRCFVNVVELGSKNNLLNLIQKYILPDTVVVSDLFNKYNCHSDENFMQLKLTQNLEFVDIETNSPDSMWTEIRATVYGKREETMIIFGNYLAEHMWRRTHENSTEELLKSLSIGLRVVYPHSKLQSC